jgi:hypothetical protein
MKRPDIYNHLKNKFKTKNFIGNIPNLNQLKHKRRESKMFRNNRKKQIILKRKKMQWSFRKNLIGNNLDYLIFHRNLSMN